MFSFFRSALNSLDGIFIYFAAISSKFILETILDDGFGMGVFEQI